MKEFSAFVITAAACVFFLTGCGAPFLTLRRQITPGLWWR